MPDLAEALRFWEEAFGFAVTMTFEQDSFIEHVMALPGQEAGPNLMLVQPSKERDLAPGPGHGPVGFFCDDIEASFARAIRAGADPVMEPVSVDGAIVALLRSPQQHEIELVQLPKN